MRNDASIFSQSLMQMIIWAKRVGMSKDELKQKVLFFIDNIFNDDERAA